jgi:hypothetical protein
VDASKAKKEAPKNKLDSIAYVLCHCLIFLILLNLSILLAAAAVNKYFPGGTASSLHSDPKRSHKSRLTWDVL